MSTTESGFTWRSQSAFVVVAAGATLSLNDFLTFPVLTGQNGGGAFLLLYIFFLFVLGLPLLMNELMLGRLTRTDPAASLRTLSDQYRASVYWKLAGLSAMLAGFLIIATFSVIAGWSLAYSFKSLVGVFDGATLETAKTQFDSFTIDSERMTLWHTLFVFVLVSISGQPLKIGLERVTLILVPLMILLLITGLILKHTTYFICRLLCHGFAHTNHRLAACFLHAHPRNRSDDGLWAILACRNFHWIFGGPGNCGRVTFFYLHGPVN
jgi:NSS family neurotransmitter:Na+ symporter